MILCLLTACTVFANDFDNIMRAINSDISALSDLNSLRQQFLKQNTDTQIKIIMYNTKYVIKKGEKKMQNQTMNVNIAKKQCPYCGREIPVNAQKCCHCGEWLSQTSKPKSFKRTILLSYFLGLFGGHRFYTGYIGIGFIQLCTFGGLGVWALIDLVSISLNKYKDKSGKELQGYNKTLGIVLLFLGIVVFLYNGNPYKFITNFCDGYKATESTPQHTTQESSNKTHTTEAMKQNIDVTTEQPTIKQTTQKSHAVPPQKPKLEVIEHHPCIGDFGSRMVCGTVMNNTNRTIGYAQVEINLYDREGSLVESTLDNINNIEPGGKWKFEAPIFSEDKVSAYKIKDVVGF